MNTPRHSARSIRSIFEAPTQRHGSGLVTRDATPETLGADMDPFIVTSLYDMAGPTFPPHPHAGFAVATYMLPESPIGFINQDSIGHHNRIPPGALHVTVAGRGVLHEEQPEAAPSGVVARGFQIWIDLPHAAREVEPAALHLAADQVPVFQAPGVRARVVLGESLGLRSAVTLPVQARIVDVALQPEARFAQTLATDENAFLLVIEGELRVNGQRARAGELVRTAADGSGLEFEAGRAGARFTLFAGMPLRQPRVHRGPFVASDAAQLQRFMRNYSAGRFGQLVPFAERQLQPQAA